MDVYVDLYGHQVPISKAILVRRTRHAGYCWGCEVNLISDVLLGSRLHG